MVKRDLGVIFYCGGSESICGCIRSSWFMLDIFDRVVSFRKEGFMFVYFIIVFFRSRVWYRIWRSRGINK